MEFFLNLAWLGLSLSLVWGYFTFAHSSPRRRRWLAVVALALLIVVLLPAISMTDDLAAMNNPGETDHLLRRHDAPHLDVAMIAIVPLLLGIFAIGVALISSERFKLRSLRNLLLEDSLRSLGLRPPPFSFSIAA